MLSDCKGEVETSSQLGLADQEENGTFVDHTLAVKSLENFDLFFD